MPTATNGSARIGWTEYGRGSSTVLLIMGFAFGQRMWHRAIPALADRYRVLTYDNRGVGDSTDNEGSFTVADLAADGLAVLDAAGVEEAHVYGASMGGLMAQQLAISTPERVRSLILGCTGTPSDDEPPEREGRLRLHIPRWLLAEVVVRTMYGQDVPRAKRREDAAILRSTPISRDGLLNQARAIGAFRAREHLGTIDTPTLVLHGDRDRTVPIDRGRELARLIPGARFELLPGSGHNYLTDNTDRANHLVRTFIDEVEAG